MALLDLAARATPRGSEGLGYSLMLSIRNVALFGSDVLGSRLADNGWHLPFVGGNLHDSTFHSLVYLNAGTTFIVFLLVPLLPGVIMKSRDDDKVLQQEVMEQDLLGQDPSLTSEFEGREL